jgi:hypothetical protein
VRLNMVPFPGQAEKLKGTPFLSWEVYLSLISKSSPHQ